MKRTLPRSLRLVAMVVLVGILAYQNWQSNSDNPGSGSGTLAPPVATRPPTTAPSSAPEAKARVESASRIRDLFAERRSGIVVEGQGTVEKVLRDDLEGSRHQRFILGIGGGYTVLISHNIDLAPRIDGVRAGDRVEFRGQYEWNERGGVIHWTHQDPQKQRPGGWLKHQGRTYR